MPRGDGTGPGGMGPMTGRAAGYCAGYNMPGYMNSYGIRTVAGMNKYLTQHKMWDNFITIKTMNTFESGFKAIGISIEAYKEIMKRLGKNEQSQARLAKQEHIRS